MLTTLKHALAQLLLQTADAAHMVGKAAHTVHRMAVAAKVVALNGPAAGVDAVVVAAARGIVHRDTTASYSLLSFPTVVLFYCLFGVFVDDDHCLRRSINDQLIVVANDHRVLTWGLELGLSIMMIFCAIGLEMIITAVDLAGSVWGVLKLSSPHHLFVCLCFPADDCWIVKPLLCIGKRLSIVGIIVHHLKFQFYNLLC